MDRTVRVANITPRVGPNIYNATIAGVPSAQVARLIASYNDRDEHLAIVWPSPGQSLDPAAVLASVRAHLGGFHLGYVVENNQPGVVHLWMADASQRELLFLGAAGAAVLQRTWGWDESPSITVTAEGRSFRFRLESNDDGTCEAIEQTAA